MDKFIAVTDKSIYDLKIIGEAQKKSWALFYHGYENTKEIFSKRFPIPSELVKDSALENDVNSHFKTVPKESFVGLYKFNEKSKKYELLKKRKAIPGGTV